MRKVKAGKIEQLSVERGQSFVRFRRFGEEDETASLGNARRVIEEDL